MFFSTTSSVLFYTFGYRFNFDRGIFIYTGSISIKAVPEKVDITVDDEFIPEKKLGILNRSIHIGGLMPGEHFIRVSAPGYTSWTKKVTVQSGLSVEFWNVLLTKENIVPERIPDTAYVTKIFQSREKGIFALTKKQGDIFSVDIFDTDTNTSEQVLSLAHTTLPLDISLNIEWSPDNTHILVPTEKDGIVTYLIVNIKTKQVVSLNDLTEGETIHTLHNPRWDPANRDYILYTEELSLYRVNIATTETLPLLIQKGVRAYNFSGQNIYYLNNENGIIYRISSNLIPTEPLQITTLSLDLLDQSPYTLILYDETRIAVRENTTGKLWLYNTIRPGETFLKEIAKKDIRGVQFSDDGKKLLFFSENEIAVYFVRNWEVQPIREYNTILQIARFSNPIRNIVWGADYEHVLFSLGNTAKMIELDNRDQRNIADIITFPTLIHQMLSYTEDNFLYFVSDIDGNTETLSRIPITEKTGILGF